MCRRTAYQHNEDTRHHRQHTDRQGRLKTTPTHTACLQYIIHHLLLHTQRDRDRSRPDPELNAHVTAERFDETDPVVQLYTLKRIQISCTV